MTTTRRRSSTASIPAAAIELATSTLNELPEKPRETWSLRDAVEQMRDTITAALNKGYTHEEIAHRLTQQGVAISVPSLRYYLTRAKKKAAPTASVSSATKTRKPRASKTNAAANATTMTDAIAAVKDLPTITAVSPEPALEPALVAIAPSAIESTIESTVESSVDSNGVTPAASNGRGRKPAAKAATPKAVTTATPEAIAEPPATPRRGRRPAAETKTTASSTKTAAKKKPQSTTKAKTTKSTQTGTATATGRRKKPAAE